MGFGTFPQQYTVGSITSIDCGTGVLTRLPKFDDDNIFGQAGISGPGIIIFSIFTSEEETRRPIILRLCLSHATGQKLRNAYGVTTVANK